MKKLMKKLPIILLIITMLTTAISFGENYIINSDIQCIALAETPNTSFTDLSKNHWAYDIVSKAAGLGFVSGYKEGSDYQFKPEANVKFSEFIKMAYVAWYDYDPGPASGIWHQKYWEHSASEGMLDNTIFGTAFKTAELDQYISRQEATTILYNLVWPKDFNSNIEQVTDLHTRTKSKHETANVNYLKHATKGVIASGLMKGYPDNTFKPTKPITRAEAATIIYNLADTTFKNSIKSISCDEQSRVLEKLNKIKGVSEEHSPEFIENYKEEILKSVNEARLTEGLKPLKRLASLDNLADIRAAETKIIWGHERPDGSKFLSIFAENGMSFCSAGENLAKGYSTGQKCVGGWLNSPGHRNNILNDKYEYIGIGFAYDYGSKTIHALQLFYTPMK